MKRPVMIWAAVGLAVAWGAVASQIPGQQIPTSANAYVAMAPDPMSTAAIPFVIQRAGVNRMGRSTSQKRMMRSTPVLFSA